MAVGATVDPHVWLDPVLAQAQVDAIRAGFEQADPAHAAEYADNARRFKEQLVRLDEAFAAGLRDCASRDMFTSHTAFTYLARRYRLTQVPVMGLAPESEPSPAELAAIAGLARRQHARYIFFETLVSSRLAEALAREVGAKTLVLNPDRGTHQGGSGGGQGLCGADGSQPREPAHGARRAGSLLRHLSGVAFIEEITTRGEWSLVFIEGALTHAMVKHPGAGDFRVQAHYGGTSARAQASPALERAGLRALEALPVAPLYARVDGVETGDGFLVMEVEVHEPGLFLSRGAGSRPGLRRGDHPPSLSRAPGPLASPDPLGPRLAAEPPSANCPSHVPGRPHGSGCRLRVQ